MNKLRFIAEKCKHSVTISINHHRDNYMSAKEELENRRLLDDDFELDPEIERTMIGTDTIVDIHCYPDNAVGSYEVLHYDVDEAINKMAKILE